MNDARKWTPGPWHLDLSDDRFIVRDANDDVVADCWNGTISDEGETPLDTCEPNARLIAAAPDLLEALKAIAGPLEEIRDDQASRGLPFGRTHAERADRQRLLAGWISQNADKVDDALELVFAALSKARGEAS